MPYDHFVELTVQGGKVYIDRKEARGAVRSQQGEKALVVEFLKGKSDNPKVNAVLLVKGPATKTHKESFHKYQQLLIKLQEERDRQKAQEESFFQENDFDYDEAVDGRVLLNQMLESAFTF